LTSLLERPGAGSVVAQAPQTVPQQFIQTARRRGDAVALRRKEFGLWRGVTWTQYEAQSRAVAGALLSWGLEAGQSVAVLGENRPEWVIGDIGIMMAGGVTAAIYATNAADGVQYVLEHSDSRFVILENAEQLDKVLEVRASLPLLERIVVMDLKGLQHFRDPMVSSLEGMLETGRLWLESPGNASALEARIASRQGSDPALFIYTSGTTGRPKGAVLSHRNLLFTAEAFSAANRVLETDDVLSFLPLSHITERLLSVVLPVRWGYTVNFVESPETVLENLREVRPTLFFAVPRVWEKLMSGVEIRVSRADAVKKLAYRWAASQGRVRARAEREARQPSIASRVAYLGVLRALKHRLGLDRTRLVISGAAPISPSVLEFFHGMGVPIREGYGQTEGSAAGTVHQGFPITPGTVGKPLPGIEINIAEDGEILLRGECVFLGYHKDPRATSETLRDGWLHTGDVGQLDANGELRITGRKKDLFITAAGKNVAPSHIENLLKASSFINDAVLVGDARKYLTALVVIDEDNVAQWAQMRKIPFTTYTDLTQNEDVIRLIESEIETVNKTLSRAESVKKFRLLPKRLAQEDGEVTPTLKVKRASILSMYAPLVEDMYRGSGEA
jgi:long-chain acyl-CoA synthetase